MRLGCQMWNRSHFVAPFVKRAEVFASTLLRAKWLRKISAKSSGIAIMFLWPQTWSFFFTQRHLGCSMEVFDINRDNGKWVCLFVFQKSLAKRRSFSIPRSAKWLFVLFLRSFLNIEGRRTRLTSHSGKPSSWAQSQLVPLSTSPSTPLAPPSKHHV